MSTDTYATFILRAQNEADAAELKALSKTATDAPDLFFDALCQNEWARIHHVHFENERTLRVELWSGLSPAHEDFCVFALKRPELDFCAIFEAPMAGLFGCSLLQNGEAHTYMARFRADGSIAFARGRIAEGSDDPDYTHHWITLDNDTRPLDELCALFASLNPDVDSAFSKFARDMQDMIDVSDR